MTFISIYRKNIWWFVPLALAAVVVLLVYWYRPVVAESLRAINVLPTAEQFTELYFEDHQNLPKQIHRRETNAFSFTIGNHEGTRVQYFYRVYMIDELDREVVIDTNTLSLNDGEYRTVIESYVIYHQHKEEQVFVELIGRDQKIHFTMVN